jgi:hypothetical protein
MVNQSRCPRRALDRIMRRAVHEALTMRWDGVPLANA